MKLTKVRRFYFVTMPRVLTLIGVVFLMMSFGPLIVSEVWFYVKEAKSQNYVVDIKDYVTESTGSAEATSSTSQLKNALNDSVFARFISTRPVRLEPVNKQASIVIERIGVNAPITMDVPVTDEKAYNEALKSGVAHAVTSDYPSENPGNTYLFAHASLNFFQLGKYSTVFNLLRKLEWGDRVHIFYDGKVYVYETVNKEVVKGWNTYPITRPVIEPILTLQTCDPPGTTLNRLVVTAKLIDVQEL